MKISIYLVIMRHTKSIIIIIIQDVVIDNESKYNEIPDNNAEYIENGPPKHLWAGIAPNTEENRLNALREDEEMLTNLNQDD